MAVMSKLPIVLLAVLVSAAARAEAPGPSTYAELIAKADAGETVDYTALRQAYPLSPGYAPYSEDSRTLFIESFQAFDAGDCATSMTKAKQSLAIDYVNFAAHGFLGDCLERTGNHAGAEREEAHRKGLLDSLTGSGDGKSVATAYVVVTMAEERALLAINGVREERQSLLHRDNREFDEISGPDKDGREHTLFFDISAPFESLMRRFDKDKGESK
jgi:hypothetical protein